MSDPVETDRSNEVATLSNEFAFVEVSKVSSGNGERLLVSSPSRERSVHLDPVVLDALTAFTPKQLTWIVESSLDADLVGADDEVGYPNSREPE